MSSANQENTSPGATWDNWPTPVLGASPEKSKTPGAPIVLDRHHARTGDGAGERARRRLDFHTDLNALD